MECDEPFCRLRAHFLELRAPACPSQNGSFQLRVQGSTPEVPGLRLFGWADILQNYPLSPSRLRTFLALTCNYRMKLLPTVTSTTSVTIVGFDLRRTL